MFSEWSLATKIWLHFTAKADQPARLSVLTTHNGLPAFLNLQWTTTGHAISQAYFQTSSEKPWNYIPNLKFNHRINHCMKDIQFLNDELTAKCIYLLIKILRQFTITTNLRFNIQQTETNSRLARLFKHQLLGLRICCSFPLGARLIAVRNRHLNLSSY